MDKDHRSIYLSTHLKNTGDGHCFNAWKNTGWCHRDLGHGQMNSIADKNPQPAGHLTAQYNAEVSRCQLFQESTKHILSERFDSRPLRVNAL